MKRFPLSVMVVICIGLLIVASVISMIMGAVNFSVVDLLSVFGGEKTDKTELARSIILELRFPRTVLCLLVGAILGLCGACLQGLFRNPLADPGIIGVSAGAGLGAAVAIVLLPVIQAKIFHLVGSDLGWLTLSSTSLFAFIGGLLSTLLVFKIGQTSYGTNVGIMLLSGVALGSLALAALGFLQFISTDTQLRDISMWQLGSVANASLSSLWVCFVVLCIMAFVLMKQANGLNALLLGEAEARHLGVEVENLKKKIIIICAFGVGLSVAVAGMIGFVGLIVPHICRTLLGPDHRKILPMSALIGAIILLVADLFARQIAAPAEVPIGIITALLGAPFFIVLLIRSRNKGVF